MVWMARGSLGLSWALLELSKALLGLSWVSPVVSCSPGAPWAPLRLSWGSPGTSLVLSCVRLGSPEAFLQLSCGSPVAFLGSPELSCALWVFS